jgi:hypothetical protein
MYPFIAVSRVDRGKLWGAEDPKSRIVLEFLTWVRKLCKADTESEFVLTGLAVDDVRKYMYLVGDFLFRKIETRAEIGSEWSIDRFKLDRQLIVVECG